MHDLVDLLDNREKFLGHQYEAGHCIYCGTDREIADEYSPCENKSDMRPRYRDMCTLSLDDGGEW